MDEVRVTIGSRGLPEEYVLGLIVEFNRGVRRAVLTAYNDNICRLVEVYSMLRDRLGDSIYIVKGTTGTRRDRGRRRLYLEIVVEYKPV